MTAETTADIGLPGRAGGLVRAWLDVTRRWLTLERVAWPATIVFVALMLRLALVAYVNPDPRDGRFDDSVFYDTTARALADGKGYVWDPTVWVLADGSRVYPNENELSPTALWPPGYPALLAVVYKLTGGALMAAKVLNAVFGALTALVTYLLARRLFGERAGIIAGFMVALLPSHVLFTAVTLSEAFFTFLFVLLAYLLVRWTLDSQRPHSLQLLGLGFLTGVAALTRGELAAFPIALFVLFLLAQRSWRTAGVWTALTVAGMAAAFLPWTVRNCVQMDSCIIGTTGVGRAFLQGHNPQSDGGPSLNPVLLFEQQFLGLPRVEREVRSSSAAQREALEWAAKHPLDELVLIPKRVQLLYRNDQSGVEWVQSNKPTFGPLGAERLTNLSNAYYAAMMALAVVGTPAWLALRRGRTVWIALVPIAYYTVIFGLVFIGNNRYHVPILPFFAALAAAPLAVLWGLVQEQWRSVRERSSAA